MSKLIPGNNKHLTLEDRTFIEQSLDQGMSFREISKYLCKDPSTISEEVKRNRIPNIWNRGSFTNPYKFCIHRFHCKKTNVCENIYCTIKVPKVADQKWRKLHLQNGDAEFSKNRLQLSPKSACKKHPLIQRVLSLYGTHD